MRSVRLYCARYSSTVAYKVRSLRARMSCGHATLLQGDNNILVLADTILVNLFKTVEGLHKCHHCWIYPCNGFESFSVLILEITLMPDWFRMKNPVSERSDSIEAFGEILSNSDVARHIGDNRFQ